MSIIRLTDGAQQYQNAHPGYTFARLTKGGNNVEIRIGWDMRQPNSASTAERDNIAADHLLAFATGAWLAAWNSDFSNPTIRVAGVEFVVTEGGWSNTEGPSLENGFVSSYRAGGTAMGYVLVPASS